MEIRGLKCLAGAALIWLFACALAQAQGTCSVRFDPATHTARIQILDQTPPYHIAVQDGWTVVTTEAFQQKALRESDQPELPCLEYWISVPADAVLQGLEVQSLPSLNQVVWDASRIAPGVYYYRLVVTALGQEQKDKIRKLAIIR